jgi:CheY-like chemotaxis protein
MANPEPTTSPKTILIVEDDVSILKVLRRILETEGYRVLGAGNGKDAVALMAEKPDLVLQDLVLPDITGYDLVSKLRAHSEDATLPILALSGYLEKPDAPWDTSVGFDALLVKPIPAPELIAAVKDHLARSSAKE